MKRFGFWTHTQLIHGLDKYLTHRWEVTAGLEWTTAFPIVTALCHLCKCYVYHLACHQVSVMPIISDAFQLSLLGQIHSLILPVHISPLLKWLTCLR